MAQRGWTESARRLLADFDALTPWCSFVPPEGLTTESAYALQSEVARLREARGERVVGYKVGCTSRAIQDQLGIHEPIFGRLFDTTCFAAGAELRHACFANLAIEGELAIRLSQDLNGTLTDEQCIEAIGSIFPVVELHHYLLPSNSHSAVALIACGGMHAGLVFPEEELACAGVIPAVRGVDVIINDCLVGTTERPWTMGSPAATLRWLSARAAAAGAPLRRGHVILTGSPLPLFPVQPKSRVIAVARPFERSFVEIV